MCIPSNEKGFIHVLAAIATIIGTIFAIYIYYRDHDDSNRSNRSTQEQREDRSQSSQSKTVTPEKDHYKSEEVGVDTLETVAAKAINFATQIEDNSKLIQSLGDAEFEKQMKANALKENLYALEHIGKYENELKGLVSGNPKIQLALDFLKQKEYFQREYDKISDKYK